MKGVLPWSNEAGDFRAQMGWSGLGYSLGG